MMGGLGKGSRSLEQKTWMVGVNWWLNDYSRIQFN
jgi:hypothetical protein